MYLGSTSPHIVAAHRQKITRQFGRTYPPMLPSWASAKHRRSTRPDRSSQIIKNAFWDFIRKWPGNGADRAQQHCLQRLRKTRSTRGPNRSSQSSFKDAARSAQEHLTEHCLPGCIQGIRHTIRETQDRISPASLPSKPPAEHGRKPASTIRIQPV